MTYKKPGKNEQIEAEMRKPPGPPIAWEYGLPVPETPWQDGWLGTLPEMPWWYPLMHFEAALGRAVLAQEQQGREHD
jgi:hypothetical protein